jgi:hypothetical protein
VVTRISVAAALSALLIVPAAEGKLLPKFNKQVARPCEVVQLDLGDGAHMFLAPLKVYLAPLDAADAAAQSDPRLAKIGELGTPGEFDAPRILRFVVPDLPPGQYAVAIWFKGYATGRWGNAMEGIHRLLTIQAPIQSQNSESATAAPPADSEDGGTPFLRFVALVPIVLLISLLLWRWRRNARHTPSATA